MSTEVYGEESHVIDISKGLWIGDLYEPSGPSVQWGTTWRTQKQAPEGYAAVLKNFVKNDRGSFQNRSPFFKLGNLATGQTHLAQQDGFFGFPPFVPATETLMTWELPAYKINQPAMIGLNGRILYNFQANSSNAPVATVGNQTITYNATAQTYQPKTFTMYKDRMYACTTAGAWYRLTGWGAFNVTPITFTEVLLPGAGNVGMDTITGIFSFKDRLFAYRDNRVWFTDVAAAGGYPEQWDATGANFFDIASAGSPAIYNAFVLNNLVYLMTGDGIYTLQVYGTPDNWVVRKLRDDMVTNHHYGSCSNGGLIYAVNTRGVFAFNGDQVVKVSQPLEFVFENSLYLGLGVASFENGVILTTQSYVAVVTPTPVTYVADSFVYYFDGEVWSEFTISNFTGTAPNEVTVKQCPVMGVTNGFAQKQYGDSVLKSVLNITFNPNTFIASGSTTGEQCTVEYKPSTQYPQDQIDFTLGAGGPAILQLSTPMVCPNPFKFSLFKRALIRMYLGSTMSRIFVGTVNDRKQTDPTVPPVAQSLLVTMPSGYGSFALFQHSLPGRQLGVQAHYMWLSNGSQGQGPIEVAAIEFVTNTLRIATEALT